MALIDTYRNNVTRKAAEIAKLTEQKAKEYQKIATTSNKIQAARRQLSSSKSASTITSKTKEIQRHLEEIGKLEKKIAEFETKIARKQKELQSEQKKLATEESKEDKKRQQQQERLQREQQNAFEAVNKTLIEHSEAIKMLNELPEEITVLFLASNPQDQGQLALDEEVRSIKEMISKSRHRDAVKLESCWAVRSGDILQYMNEFQPTIVHFSGHGSSNDELVLMDNNRNTKLVSLDAIVQAMSVANDNLRLVFFNTCHSKNQADKVTQHVEFAIGMNTSISDDAARVFSSQFYSSLSFGNTVEKSFKQAKAALMLEGIPEENTPALFSKADCDASSTCIIAEQRKQ